MGWVFTLNSLNTHVIDHNNKLMSIRVMRGFCYPKEYWDLWNILCLVQISQVIKHEIKCRSFSTGRKQVFKNQCVWCANSLTVKYLRPVAEISPENYKLYRLEWLLIVVIWTEFLLCHLMLYELWSCEFVFVCVSFLLKKKSGEIVHYTVSHEKRCRLNTEASWDLVDTVILKVGSTRWKGGLKIQTWHSNSPLSQVNCCGLFAIFLFKLIA